MCLHVPHFKNFGSLSREVPMILVIKVIERFEPFFGSNPFLYCFLWPIPTPREATNGHLVVQTDQGLEVLQDPSRADLREFVIKINFMSAQFGGEDGDWYPFFTNAPAWQLRNRLVHASKIKGTSCFGRWEKSACRK